MVNLSVQGKRTILDTSIGTTLDNIKRLYRSDDAMIAGVCAGFADYFGFDPTIVRIFAVVLLVMLLGTPALLYLALVFIMPKRPLDSSRPIDIKASVNSEMSAIGNRTTTPGAAWVSSNSEAFDAVDPKLSGTNGRRANRGISTAVTFGMLLVGFGIIAMLGLMVDPFFWLYWPLIIILVGLITLCTPGYNGWRVARAGYSVLLITVGIVLQLWRLEYYDFAVFWNTFWTLWPAGLIGIGLLVIGGTLRRDIFKLAAALLVSLAIVIGVWSFGRIGGSYYIQLPLFDHVKIDLPDSPFPWR
ncbi:MAG: PspC domain-containing protein [Coriobacteriales bacterium]|jgi:phage shock protein PspC (stress-responsive transcriptional regulator)|nr:PspC domain-containing protein [Coriobacteriales bacterium]